MTALEDVQLSTLSVTPIRVGWLEALGRLSRLVLHGFLLDDADLPRIGRIAPRLEQLVLTPRSAAQAQRISGVVGSHAGVMLTEVTPAGAGAIHEYAGPDGAEYALVLDLAAAWDMETNLEAEYALRRLLADRLPDVLGRVTFDSESANVRIVSHLRADLERIIELMTDGSAPSR